MKHHKGQIIAIDFMLTMAVTAIIIILLVSTFIFYEKKIDESTSYNLMLTKAFQVSDILIKTQGSPTNWNASNVDVIGLVSEDRMISSEKLNQFINMPEQDIKKRFTMNYNFYFNLKNTGGNSLASVGTIPSGTRTVVIKRYVLYENDKTIMEFAVWE